MDIAMLLVIITSISGAPTIIDKKYHQMDIVDLYEAAAYLRKFGYINLKDPCSTKCTVENKEQIIRALQTFQESMGLDSTGYLDIPTRAIMKKSRCVQPDLRLPRKKRYVIEGSYWGVRNISYAVTRYSDALPVEKTNFIIEKAFKVWEQHSTLKFHRKSSPPVNIEIAFARYGHGDGENFDGRGGILAHAFFPRYGGQVHLDDDETWGAMENRGIDLYSVAAHEIGHALGLQHSRDRFALMAPFYQGYFGDTIYLQLDDIQGLQWLYGKPNDHMENDDIRHGNLRSHNLEKIEENPQRHDQILPQSYSTSFDICDDPSLDAITTIGNGTTYAFKGNLYWRLNKESYDSTYPRLISDGWSNLSNHIDAALTDISGDTYFLKGENYWVYDPDGQPYKGYPQKIGANLPDVPGYMDAAMLWKNDNTPYFFKGEKYWRHSQSSKYKDFWPRSIRDISPLMPAKVDAALNWDNGQHYIFSGHYYYRLEGRYSMKLAPQYPRLTGEWWFGCQARYSGGRHKRHKKRICIDK